MTMWDNFSQNLQQILVAAQVESSRLGVDYIGSEHLLLGILKHRHNTACRELKTLGVDLKTLENRILECIPKNQVKSPVNFSFSARATRIIEVAHAFVKTLNHEVIGSEHILLGLLREGNGKPAKILIKEFEVTYKMLLEELYDIEELKVVNFMDSVQYVEKELKVLEENFHKTSIQRQMSDGRIEEMIHLLYYLGDLFDSLNRSDLKDEVLQFKDRALSSLSYEGSDEAIKDQKKKLDVHLQDIGRGKERYLFDCGGMNLSGNLSREISPLQNSMNGGISVTINIDGSVIKKTIREAVLEVMKDGETENK